MAMLVAPQKVTPELSMTQWLIQENQRSCVSMDTQRRMELGVEMGPRSPGTNQIYYVAKDSFQFLLLLLLPPECWDDRCESAHINEHFSG